MGVLSVLFQGMFLLEYLPKNEKGEKKQLKKKRNFKYHFWGGRFHMIPQSYKFSYGLCLNSFLKFWLIFNQRDQVSMFIYINRSDEVYHLVIVSKFLGYRKYLMRSVK